jgi:hypothetical protein
MLEVYNPRAARVAAALAVVLAAGSELRAQAPDAPTVYEDVTLSDVPVVFPKPTQPMRLDVAGGGFASVSSDTETAYEPILAIAVEAPLMRGEASEIPWLAVAGDLSALPGETLAASDPTTFRSVRLEAGVHYRPLQELLAAVYVAGGFATRRPGDVEPLDKTARYWEAGLRFATAHGEHVLRVGAGTDERLTDSYRWAAKVEGHLTLPVTISQSVAARMFVRAILDMDRARAAGVVRDVVQVGVVVAR